MAEHRAHCVCVFFGLIKSPLIEEYILFGPYTIKARSDSLCTKTTKGKSGYLFESDSVILFGWDFFFFSKLCG